MVILLKTSHKRGKTLSVRSELQGNGRLEVFEIIIITDQVSQIDNGIIGDDGSLERNVQANKGSLFESNLSLCSFLMLIFVLS